MGIKKNDKANIEAKKYANIIVTVVPEEIQTLIYDYRIIHKKV